MGAPLTLGRTSGGHGLTTPKTNFFHQRGRKAIHRRRGHAAMCPSFAMRPRERRRSGHREGGEEEKRGTNYSSHELRLRGQQREREIHGGGPQWRRRRISSLSSEREKERLERSSEVNGRACRAMQLWNTKEPCDEATRGQHEATRIDATAAAFPMHQRVTPYKYG